MEAFSAQASIALENAKLFEDVLNMKNYNESMLESMSNGVVSLDAERHIVKCNTAALRILQENLDTVIGSKECLGSLLVLEDITREKRLKGTMTRYMAREVVDKLLEHGEAMLGGMTQEATIMFSDIRGLQRSLRRSVPRKPFQC